jgi:hypothetical protein
MSPLSSSPLSQAAVIFALALAGLGGGWWAQGVFSASAARDAAASPGLSPLLAPPASETPAATPVAPSPASVGQGDAGAKLSLLLEEAESRGERVLPTRTVAARFSSPVFSRHGGVSDAAADLLQLTPPERAAADQAIAIASLRLQQLELARVEIAVAFEAETIFRVGAFPEEGQAVQAAFRDELRHGLGVEAADLLWELMTRRTGYQGFWNGWGEEEKEIRFSIEPGEEPDALRVTFGVARAGAYTSPEGIAGRWGGKSMSPYHPYSSYENLAGRHAYLADLLEEPLRSIFQPPGGKGLR